MTDSRSFFVSEDGSSASPPTTTPTAPAWGYDKRTCDACGADWGQMACTRGECTSISFTTRYVEPVPFMTRLSELVAPKPKPPRSTPAQKAALRAFAASTERYRTELADLDALLRAGVVDGIEELKIAHMVMHECTFTTGDISMTNLRGLSLALRAVTAYLAPAIQRLTEETK